MKTFVMMIGEFEYDGIFNSEATDPSYTSLVIICLFVLVCELMLSSFSVRLIHHDEQIARPSLINVMSSVKCLFSWQFCKRLFGFTISVILFIY